MSNSTPATSTLCWIQVNETPSARQFETCSIGADQFWNATGVEVAAGEEYSLSAAGNWLDRTIKTTPSGYSTAEAASFLSRLFLKFFDEALREIRLRGRGRKNDTIRGRLNWSAWLEMYTASERRSRAERPG